MRRTLGLGILVLLTACSQIEQLRFGNKPVAHVDLLVREQRYGQAFDFLAALPEPQKSSDAVKKRERLLRRQAAKYEVVKVAEAGTLENKQRWPEALAVLDEALERYPAGNRLAKARQSVYKSQQAVLQRLWLRLSLQQAESLPQLRALAEQIMAAGDPSGLSDELRQYYHKQGQRLATYFSDLAVARQQQGRRQEALRYFQLSDSLLEKPGHHRQIAKLKRQLQAGEGGKPVLGTLLADYERSLADGRLLEAKQQLQRAAENYPKRDLGVQQEQLAQRIAERVEGLIRAGGEHYARGALDYAIQLWQQGLLLLPGDEELQRLLSRAEAFKARYERLKQAH